MAPILVFVPERTLERPLLATLVLEALATSPGLDEPTGGRAEADVSREEVATDGLDVVEEDEAARVPIVLAAPPDATEPTRVKRVAVEAVVLPGFLIPIEASTWSALVPLVRGRDWPRPTVLSLFSLPIGGFK